MPHNRFAGENSQSMLVEGVYYGFIVALLWGGWLAMSFHGIAAGMSAWDIAFIRYSTSGLLLSPLLVIHKPAVRVGWQKRLVLSVLAGPLLLWFALGGYHYSPLVHGAFIQLVTLIVCSIILSVLILKEWFSWQWGLGVGILIAGLMLVVEPRSDTLAHQVNSDLMFATSGAMLAVFILLLRLWRISALTALILVSVYSALFYIPLYLFFKGPWALMMLDSTLLWQQVLVQGVLSGVVAIFAFSKAAQYLGTRRAAMFPALSPAIALGVGLPFNSQLPGLTQYLGVAISLLGFTVALLNTHKVKRQTVDTNPLSYKNNDT